MVCVRYNSILYKLIEIAKYLSYIFLMVCVILVKIDLITLIVGIIFVNKMMAYEKEYGFRYLGNYPFFAPHLLCKRQKVLC